MGQPTNLETDVGGLLTELLTNDFLVETLANDIDQQIEESHNNTQVVLKITPTKGTYKKTFEKVSISCCNKLYSAYTCLEI